LDPPSKQDAKKSLDNLFDMIGSEYTDTKQEALFALVPLSSDPVYRQLLLDTKEFTAALLTCLSHKNEDVVRCATAIAANISLNQESFCKQLVGEGCVKLLVAYFACSTTQVVREATRLLANVAESLGSGVACSSMQSHLDDLSATVNGKDARVNADAGRIARNLHLNWTSIEHLESTDKLDLNKIFSSSSGFAPDKTESLHLTTSNSSIGGDTLDHASHYEELSASSFANIDFVHHSGDE